jgi:endonuclease/exonuclease/phosphatase family metal-dependent hydrolase
MSTFDDLNTSDPEVVGQTDSLSVMLYNMHRRDRPPELLVVADDLRNRVAEVPDFILLQEVMHDIDAEDPNTAIIFARDLGYCCRSTRRNTDREGSAIISRYPFAYYAARQMKAQTSRMVLGQNRISIMGEFRVPTVGLVRVVNVHLTNWGFAGEVRRAQLQETLEWIAQRQTEQPADVILLGGDFNMHPDDSTFEMLHDVSITGGLVYRDNNDHSVPTFGKTNGAQKRLDYIFMATASRVGLTFGREECLWPQPLVVSKTGHRFFPSDHKAVLHRYQVGPATASSGEPHTPLNNAKTASDGKASG